MRIGARVLAAGKPGEIVSIWSVSTDDGECVRFIDVGLDGQTEVTTYRPDDVQRDRIRREVCYA